MHKISYQLQHISFPPEILKFSLISIFAPRKLHSIQNFPYKETDIFPLERA